MTSGYTHPVFCDNVSSVSSHIKIISIKKTNTLILSHIFYAHLFVHIRIIFNINKIFKHIFSNYLYLLVFIY